MKFLFLLFLLGSCATMPPDVPGCTGYAAADWPKFRETFYKLCSDDPACKPRLSFWRGVVDTWAVPTDSGTCVTWMTGKDFDVDPAHPYPKEYSSTGKSKTWPQVAEESMLLPARDSVAPMKTFVQSFCHNQEECGGAGNWEGTIKKTDAGLAKQSALVKTQKAAK